MLSKIEEIIKMFKEIDVSEFPHFDKYKKPLEMGLWILRVAKEKLGIRKLTAEQIASIIIEVKETSIKEMSIIKSFNVARGKVHAYKENGQVYYQIMMPGKKHLISQVKKGSMEVSYFEPDKRYTSKRLLSKNLLQNLKGELRIVDPYASERTLDILSNIKNRGVKLLTRVENLRERDRERFLRELHDFKSENPNIEFRNYAGIDIHDRYIISPDFLIILGHSIKDLGSKESFAIKMDNKLNKNIFDAVSDNFNRRWKASDPIPKIS